MILRSAWWLWQRNKVMEMEEKVNKKRFELDFGFDSMQQQKISIKF